MPTFLRFLRLLCISSFQITSLQLLDFVALSLDAVAIALHEQRMRHEQTREAKATISQAHRRRSRAPAAKPLAQPTPRSMLVELEVEGEDGSDTAVDVSGPLPAANRLLTQPACRQEHADATTRPRCGEFQRHYIGPPQKAICTALNSAYESVPAPSPTQPPRAAPVQAASSATRSSRPGLNRDDLLVVRPTDFHNLASSPTAAFTLPQPAFGNRGEMSIM